MNTAEKEPLLAKLHGPAALAWGRVLWDIAAKLERERQEQLKPRKRKATT